LIAFPDSDGRFLFTGKVARGCWEKDVPMLLHRLIFELDSTVNLNAVPNVKIRGVCEDSRLAERGDLFIARAGTHTEGAKYIGQAEKRGVVAVVTERKARGCRLPQVIVPDCAARVSEIAEIFFGRPSQKLRVLGVTGTNGKTTTAYLIRHILNKVNHRCGMIGTVETDDGKTQSEAKLTTPGAVDVARLMAAMQDNGCSACAMEVSSHALDQDRVAGVQFAGTAFTNLTQDHLDYHKTMNRYGAAKARLFENLGEDAVAVFNVDDPWSERMAAHCRGRQVGFGFGAKADYRARDFGLTSQGSRFVLNTPDGSAEVTLPMIGKHNIANALGAAALAGEVFGLSVHQIARSLRDAHGAPGRLEAVRCGQPFTVLVDYAHTHDALEKAILALRPVTKKKLRVVFGCGGDRDRKKRPRMAREAERLADVVYVTSDNPRTEDAGKIIQQIVRGFLRPRSKDVIVEPDRRFAISKAIEDARAGDVVLIAGKGHEKYQIIGDTRHHFDDVEEVKMALQQVSKFNA
jgi:UDP-N-acetylmuramoyl-L-alanyl-D-glutamate--2,6-diaminopimelate ligase